MPWTKSGTVSVTNGSVTVYGAGTTWASAKLSRSGDIFKAPDGRDYEVLSVQSNTQLTLTTGYLGTTASAQAYALIHTGLLPAELAVGVSDLQSKYLTTVSQLYEWETSTAETVSMTNPATGITAQVKPIAGLIADITVAKTAAGTSNTPAGNIAATTVQAAINELDAEKAALSGAVFSGSVTVSTPALLGYGPGAGGTVTQATSKETAVTLNKPCGQITMHNAALGAGAAVTFRLANTLISANSGISIFANHPSGSYRAQIVFCEDGACYIAVQNTSGASLSDAVTINFEVIKGATA